MFSNLKYSTKTLLNYKTTNYAINSNSFRRFFLVLGAIVFAIGLFFAINNQPHLVHKIQWQYAILIIVVGVPLTMIANAFELNFRS